MRDRLPAKYATSENSILEVKESKSRLPYVHDQMPGSNFAKFASMKSEPLQEGEDGYLYVRVRAISSRVNKNHDGWPSEELASAYKTFVGRPIFVDHNNEDVRRTRGVIVDARLHVDDDKTSALDPYYATAPDNHKPPTWIELLHEVDAKTFPELAKDIRAGKVYATSMGANIEKSVCSVCDNEAVSPSQYCDHIRSKGATFEITSDNGEKVKKKAYEDCYGVNFFEDSYVFDPADETALVSEHVGKTADAPLLPDDEEDRKRNHIPQSDMVGAPAKVDTLRDESRCTNCDAGNYQQDSDGVMRCETCGAEQEPRPLDNPDLTKAQSEDDGAAPTEDGSDEVKFDDKQDDPSASTGSDFIKPIEPIKPASATKEINEMKFTTKIETDSKAEIDSLLPVEAAQADTVVGYPGGIHGGTHGALAQAGLSGYVNYPPSSAFPEGVRLALPANEEPVPELGIDPATGEPRKNVPGSHFKAQIFYKKDNGLPHLGEVPISLEFPDDQLAHAQAIVNAGGPANRVSAQPKKVIKPNTTSKDKPKDEKVISDQLAPVESSKLVIKDEMDKEADRRKIIRKEDPDGSRTEEIVEESGDLVFSDDGAEVKDTPKNETEAEKPKDENAEEETSKDEEESKSEKEKVPVAASVDSESKLLAAFTLADEAVDMGLIEKRNKLAFVALLEKETSEQIEARKDMMDRVREAGFRRSPKIAGIQSLPRTTAGLIESASVSLNNVPDEALFL